MRLIFAASLLLLAGCTTPTLGSASEGGGIINHYGWEPNHALDVAQAHCAKYGKSAVISSENDLQDHMTFQCVPK